MTCSTIFTTQVIGGCLTSQRTNSLVSFGTNLATSADNFAEWFRANAGAPNSYCSGNVFDIPEGETVEQEVANRRNVTKRIVAILTESETLKGEERAAFVREKFDALEALIKS